MLVNTIAGDGGLACIWDVPSGDRKQSIQGGYAILAVQWVNLVGCLSAFLVGASDGSITVFYDKSVKLISVSLVVE
jgi:WD40 repeat protein